MKIYCLNIEKVREEIESRLGCVSCEDMSKAEILICRGRFSKIDKEILDKMSNLKMIATMSTGFDHIDLEECKRRGVVVCNVPCYCEDSVAEHVFALILGLMKNLFKKGGETSELRGKILGVIGGGKIGLRVVELGKAFGMKVICYDIVKNLEASGRLGFEYVELDDLLCKSDIISLHVPLTNKTSHLIDGEKIELMKTGVVLINCSRKEVIDSKALLNSLESGKIKGVGLDIDYGEDFLNMKNVIITPHNAANTGEAQERVLNISINNICNFIDGKRKNVVN